MNERLASLMNTELVEDGVGKSISVWQGLLTSRNLEIVEPWQECGNQYQTTMWADIMSLKAARSMTRSGIFRNMDVVVSFVGFRKMGLSIQLNSTNSSAFWSFRRAEPADQVRFLSEISGIASGELKPNRRGLFLSQTVTSSVPEPDNTEVEAIYPPPSSYDYICEIRQNQLNALPEKLNGYIRDNFNALKALEARYDTIRTKIIEQSEQMRYKSCRNRDEEEIFRYFERLAAELGHN
jgi:hypothetical protein